MTLRAIYSLFTLLVFLGLAAEQTSARPVDSIFTLNEQLSDLRAQLDTDYDTGIIGTIHLTDNDTQKLGGTISTTFDFGESGAFPSSADLTINDGQITPLANFNLFLGVPNIANANFVIADSVANLTSINQPQPLSLISSGATFEYEFDASKVDVFLNQGIIDVTGLVTETVDLAEDPISGTAQPGTTGKIFITPGNSFGPFLEVNARLEMPLKLNQDSDLNGQIVTVDLDGEIVANSTFVISLEENLADFDSDFNINQDDLTKWQTDFGGSGSDADDDGDTDGKDFLIWQRQYIQPVSSNSTVAAVPEPTSIALLFYALTLVPLRKKRSRFTTNKD